MGVIFAALDVPVQLAAQRKSQSANVTSCFVDRCFHHQPVATGIPSLAQR